MFVVYDKEKQKVPIKIWLDSINDIEPSCLEQAVMVANHPAIFRHVALMPDTHTGYALPIGGVAALQHCICPYFVGVDIGCGMAAARTNIPSSSITTDQVRGILDIVKRHVPVGVGGDHEYPQKWDNFDWYMDTEKSNKPQEGAGWWTPEVWESVKRNLGTMGSNNHFVELQKSDDGFIWLMIHSGSRNLGFKIANYYHERAVSANRTWFSSIPDPTMAFLPTASQEGLWYCRDMSFAMEYAAENRRRIMEAFKFAIQCFVENVSFEEEINIHHNFASLENHFGQNVWVHRKGATSAKEGQMGIIPGSMGTSSYIVKGKGNRESFMSCSHGAGRKMGRLDASRHLSKEDSEKAMEGIVYDGFAKMDGRKGKKEDLFDLGESPLAYKDIDTVIKNQTDLVDPIVKLSPLGVLKG